MIETPETRDIRIFVILNPAAGTRTGEEIRQTLERHFNEAGCSYKIYETTEEDDLTALTRKALAQDYTTIVAAGGDGTASAVAAGLVQSSIPLGIVPVGTANVLAQELGIPLELDAACQLLIDEHTTTTIDAMQMDNRHYFLHISMGLDAIVMRDTPRQSKRRFGRLAYIWTGLVRLLGHQPRRFTIVTDGQRIRPRAAQVVIANGAMLGMPQFSWGEHIHPNDGQLDVSILYARNLIDYLIVFWFMLWRQPKRSRKIRYRKARNSIIVHADDPLPIQADGETFDPAPLHVRVVPSAVHIIVPDPAPAEIPTEAAADLLTHTS